MTDTPITFEAWFDNLPRLRQGAVIFAMSVGLNSFLMLTALAALEHWRV